MAVSSLVDVWLGSKYSSGALDARREMASLNGLILQYLCLKQFFFRFQKWEHYIVWPRPPALFPGVWIFEKS